MRPQIFPFLKSQPKHKINGKAFLVSSELLIQAFCGDAIYFGKIKIKNDFLAPNSENFFSYDFRLMCRFY